MDSIASAANYAAAQVTAFSEMPSAGSVYTLKKAIDSQEQTLSQIINSLPALGQSTLYSSSGKTVSSATVGTQLNLTA